MIQSLITASRMAEHPVSIFFAYSRKDEALMHQLDQHLAPLKWQLQIKSWHDGHIQPGQEWKAQIDANLENAQIILLLISSNFIASPFCYEVELKLAIERHNAGDAWVVPIILRPCFWEEVPVGGKRLGGFQALPKDAKPVTQWSDADEAFTYIVKAIASKIQEWKAKGISHPTTKPTPPPLAVPVVAHKELHECNPQKILFLKNIRDPRGGWSYTLKHIQQLGGSTDSRVFELYWLITSKGAKAASKGDLMILNQQARVTHIVEMLDEEVRETQAGYVRWVRIVWMPNYDDWSQLPHQKDVLGFEPPRFGGGAAYSFLSPNFGKFHLAWQSLEAFQQHVFQQLTQQ